MAPPVYGGVGLFPLLEQLYYKSLFLAIGRGKLAVLRAAWFSGIWDFLCYHRDRLPLAA